MLVSAEKLATALDALDPRHVEVLELSLRRRVPDHSLARILGCPIADVARRRALAIDELAATLELERGEELGAVLASLLEPDSWNELDRLRRSRDLADETAEPTSEESASPRPWQGAGRGRFEAEGSAPVVPLRTRGPEGGRDEPAERTTATDQGSASQGALRETAEPRSVRTLAEGQEPQPPHGGRPGEPASATTAQSYAGYKPSVSRWPFGTRLSPLLLAFAAVVGLTLAIAALLLARGGSEGGQVARSPDQPRRFVPQGGGPLALPFPSDPSQGECYGTLALEKTTSLRSAPDGRAIARIGRRTEWGSPRVLSIVAERGDWLAVLAPELRNGEVGWVRRDVGRIGCVRWSLHVDLSRRLLVVRRSGTAVRKIRVGVGRPQNPTPTGRFAVTDRLRVADRGSPYGCCVLALTGHQPRLPPGWPGGDRLAIHATTDPSSIGRAVSLGCLRAEPSAMRWLIATVPLGTPVFIHR